MRDDPEPTNPMFTQQKRCWNVRKSRDVGGDVAGLWGRDSVFEFRSPEPIWILIRKDASKLPRADSPCMDIAPATERYAITSSYRPVLHVDWPWPPGSRCGVIRGRGRGPWSGLLGSLMDSDVNAGRATGSSYSSTRLDPRWRPSPSTSRAILTMVRVRVLYMTLLLSKHRVRGFGIIPPYNMGVNSVRCDWASACEKETWTRNAWQSLAYRPSPLGAAAAVSPPRKYI